MILREQACVERLQAYVTENGLSTNDGKMLDKWASGEKNLLITIYKDGRFRYSNDAKVMVMVPEMNEWEDTSWLYEVKFADRTAQAGVSYYAEYGYYAAASVLGGVISMAVFALMLVMLIRGKIRYIDLMEQEIQILKGGDLDYRITVKGRMSLPPWQRKLMPCAVPSRNGSRKRRKRERPTVNWSLPCHMICALL